MLALYQFCRKAVDVRSRFVIQGFRPWHLSVQKHAPELWQRQARLHQLDDAAKPSGEPGGSAACDFSGLSGRAFFSLGVA